MSDSIDPKRFALTGSMPSNSNQQGPPCHKRGERFLKGPIPFNWLAKAARQPGKALHVAIAIWFFAGVTRSRSVALSSRLMFSLGSSRFSTYRGLKALEEVGLVTVIRHRGRNPRVTIQDFNKVDEQ
jgi:hypothetical protein